MAKIAKKAKEIPMEGKEDFLTIKQTSQYLRIPLRTVYRLAEQGKIISTRIGGRIRCLKNDIEKYYTLGTDFSGEPVRKHAELNNLVHVCEGFIERRTFPRINSNFKCRYSINLSPLREIHSEGIIANISAGGVLLVDKDRIDEIGIDDPVYLKFDLILDNNQKTEVETMGKVVRKTKTCAGIKFRGIDKGLRDRILEYVG